MAYPVRCFNRVNGRTCFARRSLAKRPADYVDRRYQPRCPSCGARKWHIDTWRVKHEVWGNGDTCDCGGYHFIPRKGSKFCYHHPEAEKHQTERYEHL